MAENDFVLGVGEGWIEIPNAHVSGVLAIAEDTLATMIANEEWPAISQIFEDASIIAPNSQILAARLINTGRNTEGDNTFRVWYRQ